MLWTDFEKQKELGRGATARVWLARRISDGTPICLKVFHPGLGEAAERRILREAEFSASLIHPNIVRVLGFVEGGDTAVLALELLDNGNLETYQASLPYVLPEVSVAITIEILKALEFAHSLGVIHRDLKPANVLLDKRGRVAVADFGLARVMGSDLTTSVGLLGSVDYMSPEQVSGEPAKTASDLFSVASVLYFLVTGTRPFTRLNAVATMAAIRGESPEPPQKRNPKISAALSQLILKGLQKDPAERFQDAAEFRRALEENLAEMRLWPFEFAEWQKDPPGRTMASLETAAEALIARSEAHLSRGHWGPFLETLSHLSMKAPSTPALSRLTEAYREARNRRRRGALFVWSGAAAGLALLLWGVWPRSAALTTPPRTDAVASVAAPAAVVKPAPKIAAPKPMQTGQVKFQVPDAVTIFWDGHKIDPKQGLVKEKLGEHWLLMEREGFDPIRSKVTVRADKPTVIKVD